MGLIMKILEYGNRLDVVSEDFTCRACHTKFRAFGHEYDTSTAYDEDTKNTVYIHSAVCPVCKTRCYNVMVLE